MTSTGKDIYKWNDVSIPTIIQEKPESIIYQVDNKIFIECISYTLISSDYGISWIREDKKVDVEETSNIEESSSNKFEIFEDQDVEVIEEDEEVIDNQKYNFDMILLNQDAIKLLIESIM